MTDYREFETFTDYAIADGDQHIYEPLDCYTAYIEEKYKGDTLRSVDVDGHSVVMGGGNAIPLDTQGNNCYRPGSLKEMLKTMKAGSGDTGGYQFMPIDPAFQNRDLRLTQMDMQNTEVALMFSGSMGLFAEPILNDDNLYYASSWAYLRYLDENWGLSHANRIFMAPTISFRDNKRTVEQLEWMFERGCKAVSILPGPAYGRSPADPHYDPIWRCIESAGAVVAMHINEAIPGYKSSRSAMWGEDPNPSFYTQSAWQWMWAYGETPSLETFTALIYHNLFARFPGLHIVSAEVGAEWIPGFVRHLDKMRGMGRNGPWIGGQLTERPSEIFKRHFRVVPYWEDDLGPVFDAVGTNCIVGGSDFPHSEGLAFPSQLVDHMSMLSPADQKFVMRDNLRSLLVG